MVFVWPPTGFRFTLPAFFVGCRDSAVVTPKSFWLLLSSLDEEDIALKVTGGLAEGGCSGISARVFSFRNLGTDTGNEDSWPLFPSTECTLTGIFCILSSRV